MSKQLDDILNSQGNLLIQASAGTGKTTAIMAKIEQLLSSGCENLLILTFSNAGVNEIKNRIKERGFFLNDTLVSTFHSFCWGIIKENIEITQYQKIPRIIDEATAGYQKYSIIKSILTEVQNDKTLDESVVQNLLDYSSSGYQMTSEKFFVDFYDKVCDILDSENWLKNALNKYTQVQPDTIYKTASLIVAIIKKLDYTYRRFKLENNYIDFQDMEKTALVLLRNPGILDYYKNKYSYILVDEYQDTSFLQEEILGMLERDNCFFVGDLKQSIYGFRNATPKILQDRYNLYSNSDKGNIKYLTLNYRSDENIINFVNDIFSSTNDKEGFFSEEAKLIFGRNTTSPTKHPVNIQLVNSNLNDTKIENSLAIIDTIKSLVGTPMYFSRENQIRQCKYSDILVLSSKLATTKDVLVKELQKAQIPYFISQKTNLLKENEIRSLLSILKMFTFKSDLDFIHFFHKGFLGFTDDDLAEIKNLAANKSFYEALTLSTNPKFTYFKSIFDNTTYENFLDKAHFFLSSVGFFDSMNKYNSPEIASENVNSFMFWMSNLLSEHPDWQLTDFILYVDELSSEGIQLKTPSISFEDAIEVSTIHSVKGQDAPIVILAFTDLPSSFSAPIISFDMELGFGIKFFDSVQAKKGNTPIKTEIDNKQKELQDSEEKRLLYVALTRARDRLFIIGKENPKTINYSLLGFILKNLDDTATQKTSLYEIKRVNFSL